MLDYQVAWFIKLCATNTCLVLCSALCLALFLALCLACLVCGGSGNYQKSFRDEVNGKDVKGKMCYVNEPSAPVENEKDKDIRGYCKIPMCNICKHVQKFHSDSNGLFL